MFGVPAPGYIKYQDRIQRFIKENNITPIRIREPIHIPGPPSWGIPAPDWLVKFRHVHINGNTYILNDAQFEALDKVLVREFDFNLKNVGVLQNAGDVLQNASDVLKNASEILKNAGEVKF